MAMGVVTVIGFMVVLGLTGGVLMYYLSKGLDSKDAGKVDRKPETSY